MVIHILLLVLLLLSSTKTKATLKGRVYLADTPMSLFIIAGSQDRKSNLAETWRQELDAEDMGGVLLTELLCLVSYRTQHDQPGGGTTHSGTDPPASFIK